MDRIAERDGRKGVGGASLDMADSDATLFDPFARTRFRVVRDEKRALRGRGRGSRGDAA